MTLITRPVDESAGVERKRIASADRGEFRVGRMRPVSAEHSPHFSWREVRLSVGSVIPNRLFLGLTEVIRIRVIKRRRALGN